MVIYQYALYKILKKMKRGAIMNITLEKVDEVINRTGVSYKVAKETLELCEGDVLKTLVYLEDLNQPKQSKKLNGQEIVDKLKELVNSGLVNQILIEKNGKTILDLPIMAGAISTIIFTLPTVAGIIAAVATGCEIKIVKKDGGIINFNELSQEKFDEFMNKVNSDRKSNKSDCCQDGQTDCCKGSKSVKVENEFDEDEIYESDTNHQK